MATIKKPIKKKPVKTTVKKRKTSELTQLRRQFIDNYFKSPTNDKAQAYIDAGGTSKNPAIAASNLFEEPACKKYYNQLAEAQKERTGMDADVVLDMLAKIATCDVNEIVQHRLEACRYCYGKDHRYHWVNKTEHELAVEIALRKADEGIMPDIPDDSGGFGFDPNDTPHAKCPQCHGHGVARVHVTDTRKLTGAAALLYDGVEITKNGLKIKTLSRDKAIYSLAKKFGLLNDRVMLDTPKDSPLAELIKSVSGNTLRPPSQD